MYSLCLKFIRRITGAYCRRFQISSITVNWNIFMLRLNDGQFGNSIGHKNTISPSCYYIRPKKMVTTNTRRCTKRLSTGFHPLSSFFFRLWAYQKMCPFQPLSSVYIWHKPAFCVKLFCI